MRPPGTVNTCLRLATFKFPGHVVIFPVYINYNPSYSKSRSTFFTIFLGTILGANDVPSLRLSKLFHLRSTPQRWLQFTYPPVPWSLIFVVSMREGDELWMRLAQRHLLFSSFLNAAFNWRCHKTWNLRRFTLRPSPSLIKKRKKIILPKLGFSISDISDIVGLLRKAVNQTRTVAFWEESFHSRRGNFSTM